MWTGVCIGCVMMASLATSAATQCAREGIIVFDGSGSMAEMGFNDLDAPRILTARRAMHRAIPPIAAQRDLGLLIYGPGGADSCSGVDVRFTPRPDAASAVLDALDRLQPAGDTPLTAAVRRAADVLSGPGDIVLVTDGKETCGGAPCALAADLATRAGLTVHVIGFKVRGDRFAWEDTGGNDYRDAVSVASCLADRTGGSYFAAESAEDLVTALHRALGCTVIGSLPAPARPPLR